MLRVQYELRSAVCAYVLSCHLVSAVSGALVKVYTELPKSLAACATGAISSINYCSSDGIFQVDALALWPKGLADARRRIVAGRVVELEANPWEAVGFGAARRSCGR